MSGPPVTRTEQIANSIALTLLPLLQSIPRSATPSIGRALGLLAYLLWKRPARVASENLKHAFPDWTTEQIQQAVRATFANWGHFVLLFTQVCRFSERDWNERTAVEGKEHAEAALARGKGAILISGHFGPFEIGPACAVREGFGMSVVARYAKSSAMTEKVNEVREASGYEVLVYDARGFKAMRKLRNNELVCILIDQDANENGIFVRFFNRLASTTPGPVVLAARTGAALLPAAAVLDDEGRYRLIVGEEVPNPGPQAGEAEIQATVQALTDWLEQLVRRYPTQYLWMHRRWKTRPPEEIASSG